MYRALLIIASAAILSTVHAQVTPFTINVNYGWSSRFDLKAGGSGQIRGLEVGVSQSVVKLPLLGEARVGATALLGKTLGGDSVDGNVYRLFAWYKTPTGGPTGAYGLGGLHWATAQSKGGSFDNASGFGLDMGIGFPLKIGPSVPGLPNAAIEIMLHQGSRAQTRGFSVGLNVRF